MALSTGQASLCCDISGWETMNDIVLDAMGGSRRNFWEGKSYKEYSWMV